MQHHTTARLRSPRRVSWIKAGGFEAAAPPLVNQDSLSETQMQAVDREAAQLVRQFLAVSPQQQAPAAKALVQFCHKKCCGKERRDAGGRVKQCDGKEWSDAGCRAGVVAALVQAAKIVDPALQTQAVSALACIMIDHNDNQSAAAAAGAIPLVLQLTKSSDASLQKEAA